MVFEEKFKVGMEDVNRNNEATNRAILAFLEDVACSHSTSIGFGPLKVNETGTVWILLDWKVEIIKRPLYNDIINVKTWSRKIDRVAAYRDFEIYSEAGDLLVIGTSRWFLMDVNTRRPIRLTEEHVAAYQTEENKKVFEEEMSKVLEPEKFEYSKKYSLQRRDIDMNNHMHNLNYLDVAYEVLPEEVYKNNNFNNIIIEYKKEIVYGDEITCYYSNENGKHIVTLKTDDKINAIIVLD